MTNISQSFYLQDGDQKSTGIDMEQNYVTVTRVYSVKNWKSSFNNQRHVIDKRIDKISIVSPFWGVRYTLGVEKIALLV